MSPRRSAVSTALALFSLLDSTVLATTKVRDITVGAFSDSTCQTAITVKYETVTSNTYFNSTESGSGPNITFNTGAHNWPSSRSFGRLSFDGANQTGSAGSNVYWKVPQPDQGCRYVMMLPWPEQHSSMGEVSGGDGFVTMNVGSEQCMYSTFANTDTTMFWGQCCGDDCQHYAVNSTELGTSTNSKRELGLGDTMTMLEEMGRRGERAAESDATTMRTLVRREAPTSEPIPALLPRQAASSSDPQPISADDGQYLAQYMSGHWDDPSYLKYLANYMNTVQWWNCGMGTKGTNKWNAPGQQVAVGGSQPCGSQSAPCNFQTTKGETKGSSVGWSDETSHATTNGGSVGLDLGLGGNEGGLSGGLSGSYKHSVTDTVSHGTSQTFSDTTSFSVSQTIQQEPGTKAILTYFPSLDCYSNQLDCGGGWVFPLDTCSANGQGDFRIVYVD